MKERVFLSNNQDGMVENYRMMHFLNVTDVLTNRVNCSGSTLNLTSFWRVVRDLRTLLVKLWSMFKVFNKPCHPHVFCRKKRGLCVTVRRLSGCLSVHLSIRQHIPSNFSYTIDARIIKPTCMIPLCIQISKTYLKFLFLYKFWNNSDSSDFTPKMQFPCELFKKLVKNI